jgi:hypothetical protein
MSRPDLLLDTRIHVDGVPVRVTAAHWGDYGLGPVYHFEYRSVADPPRPIPISETGYRSDFLLADAALTAQELEAYAETYCALILSAPAAAGEPDLFG